MTTSAQTPALPRVTTPAAEARSRTRSLPRPTPELLGLLVLSAVLFLWGLSRNGMANEYYAAAVRSMAGSWHAFLYGSFDQGGLMTVDKPPLALWVQALSVRAFGFSSWSMLVPQALMGVASVGLVYDLGRRRLGRVAGFAAGLALALTPITVAISRHNNPDALLVLCAVAALWFTVRGLEDGRTRWLVLAGLSVGLGFEAKMAAALMVVPGIAAAWLWVRPRGGWAAVRSLLAGGAAMLAAGLAWPLLLWLTPAGDRPWVSGTTDNSIWSLIFGYNGLGRLFGQSGGPGGGGPGGGPGGGGPGGGAGPFGGDPGPLRLLNESLGGQGGWLLGVAIVGGLAVLAATRLRRRDPLTGWLIAVGGAFAVTAVAFSTAKGIFHPYYVSLLAPFTALLAGAAVWAALRNDRLGRIAAPLALLAGVACELAVLANGDGGAGWAIAPMVGAALIGGALLLWSWPARTRALIVAIAFGGLLLAPASWSAQTLGHATSGTFPAGGSASASAGGFGGMGGPGGAGEAQGGMRGGPPPGFAPPSGQTGAPPSGMPMMGGGAGAPGAMGGGGPFGGDTASLTAAVAYVRGHGGGVIGVSSQQGAASSIIRTGAQVAGIGGFSGRESEVSASWLADAVQAGRIRWVLNDQGAGGLPNDSRTGARSVMSAVAQACTPVTLSTSSSSTTTSGSTLYDCRGAAAKLRAAG